MLAMLSVLIVAVLAGSRLVAADCIENQFTCLSNTCIDKALMCNGQKDCDDGSDETFVTCYDTNCAHDDLYRCNYGGCVPNNVICDGKQDCWDNSDENKFECADETNIDELIADLRDDCGPTYALSCMDKNKKLCLKWSQICDGVIDCSNGRDEGNELCSSSLCTENSFRCQNGACIEKASFCNRKVDCADGSDEIPAICRPLESVTRDPPVLPTDKDSEVNPIFEMRNSSIPIPPVQSIWQPNGCTVELQPGMHVSDYFSDFSYRPNTEVPLRTVVAVSCDEGYENFNGVINRCVDNNWANDIGCVRYCDQSPMTHNIRYATQCVQNEGLGNCIADTFILNTELRVTCAAGFEAAKDGSRMGKHICDVDGSWHTKEANPNCKPICGIKSIHHPNLTPWTVSLFERDNNGNNNFKCSGTILSPYVVLTSESCFDNQINLKDDHIFYSIVEGDHSVGYTISEEHGYNVHNVSDIHIVSYHATHKAALLTLVKPFKFDAKVRPICFETTVTLKNDENVENTGDFRKYRKGSSLTVLENGNYILSHLVVNDDMSYKIEAFIRPIVQEIKDSEQIF